MTLRDAMLSGFEDYLRFAGRTSRRRFQLWLAGTAGLLALAVVLDGTVSAALTGLPAFGTHIGYPLAGTAFLVLMPPTLAMAARRLHDAGHAAAWLWLLAVPGLGWLGLAWLLARPGVGRTNRHGEPAELLESL